MTDRLTSAPVQSASLQAPRFRTLRAAWVIGRRDFAAVVFSRSFLFFLIGPAFPLLIAALVEVTGARLAESTEPPQLGIAMSEIENNTLLYTRERLANAMAGPVPELVIVRNVSTGESFDAGTELRERRGRMAAIVSGTLSEPILTGSRRSIGQWKGVVGTLAAAAMEPTALQFPHITEVPVRIAAQKIAFTKMDTARAAQTLLFLLSMLLAGLVLSNLVEEKGNKIIEVLASAAPIEAILLGKLFAMLAFSLLVITVWLSIGAAGLLASNSALLYLAQPAVGWTPFLVLALVYFTMAYLLLGSVFLVIGAFGRTARDVQTLSMPVTMSQLLVFLLATVALAQSGTRLELAAILVPFSSPYVMIARAAQAGALWTHVLALAWQVAWVALIITAGSNLFRRRVMQSGSVSGRPSRSGIFARESQGHTG